MICSLVSCLDVGQLMLSSLSDNFKKHFWPKIKTFILLSSILKRHRLWWAMRVVGVPEWIVVIAQAMYNGAKSKVSGNGSYSDEVEVKVSVHQGSVLSPLLLIIALEALSRDFRTSCSWEILYADDLVLIAETLDLLMEKLKLWKDNMENKGLRVNMGKTKVMICGKGLNTIKPSGKYPCSVCRK